MSSSSYSPIEYRPDIDGLRAIAVIAVIIFHINPTLFAGFIGVDVFFVISGFLITKLILNEYEQTGRFDYTNFYERRIKRLFPLLFLVLLVTIAFALMILTPPDAIKFFQSVLYGIFSIANFFFYGSIDTSYFATSSEELPVLHLWSLGVEEQFYLVWPFLLLLMGGVIKSNKYFIVFLIFTILLSISYAHFLFFKDQSFAYYMPFTRAWELIAGALTGFLAHKGYEVKSKTLSNYISIIGLILLALSFTSLTSQSVIPGFSLFPAVIGTALILFGNGHSENFLRRALSVRWLVFIGLLSYSLYLWHWPILAFLRYTSVHLGFIEIVLFGVIVIGLSVISYISFEKPLRRKQISTAKVYIFYFVLPALLITMISVFFIKGYESKQNWMFAWDEYEKQDNPAKPAWKYSFNCQTGKFRDEFLYKKRCLYPQDVEKADVLLIGDSNAAHYLGMLRVLANNYNFSIKNVTASSCPLILNTNDYSWISRKYREGCNNYRSVILDEIKKHRTVFIGGNWTGYENRGGEEFKRAFRESISIVSPLVDNIVILGKIPIFRNYKNNCEKRAVKLDWIECSQHFNSEQEVHEINKFVETIALEMDNVHFFDVRHSLCVGNSCSPYLDGEPVYYDSNHLSMDGSRLIGQRLLDSSHDSLYIFDKLFAN